MYNDPGFMVIIFKVGKVMSLKKMIELSKCHGISVFIPKLFLVDG